MTAATNTTLGQIKLAGDFYYSEAGIPHLRPTGVIPFRMNYTLFSTSSLVPFQYTVDTKGRIIDWNATRDASILYSGAPNGGIETLGVITWDSNLFYTNSDGSSLYLNIATTAQKGLCYAPATGNIILTGNTLSCTAPLATGAVKGLVKIGSGLEMNGNILSVQYATDLLFGIITASGSDNTFYIGAGGSLNLNNGSPSTLGVVQPGSGMSIAGDGTLSMNTLPLATTSTTGIIKVGTGLSVAGDGTLAIQNASVANLGIVKPGTNLTIDGTGVLSIPLASSSQLGLVKPGTGFGISAGVLSFTKPEATTSTKGTIQASTGFTVASGVLSSSLSIATESVTGKVKPGANLQVTSDGTLSLKNATYSEVGLVYPSSGLTVNGTGVLSTIPATSSNIGAVISGGGFSIDADAHLSVNKATSTTVGTVIGGRGIYITSANDTKFNTEQGNMYVNFDRLDAYNFPTSVVNYTTEIPGSTTSFTYVLDNSNSGTVQINLLNWNRSSYTCGYPLSSTYDGKAFTLTPDMIASEFAGPYYATRNTFNFDNSAETFANNYCLLERKVVAYGLGVVAGLKLGNTFIRSNYQITNSIEGLIDGAQVNTSYDRGYSGAPAQTGLPATFYKNGVFVTSLYNIVSMATHCVIPFLTLNINGKIVNIDMTNSHSLINS